MDQKIALIVDIVGSRNLPDRARAQRDITEAFARAHEAWQPIRPLYPTVGDEFQAVFSHIADAVSAATTAALLLDDTVALRCGFGRGEVTEVEGVPEGSAWWNARAAIDRAHQTREAGQPEVLSDFADPAAPDEGAVRATLRLRDHVLARMKARERRIAAQLLLDIPQSRIAAAESISQSAVSQNAHRSGARAVREALLALKEVRS